MQYCTIVYGTGPASYIVGNPAAVVAYKLKIHRVTLLTGEPDISIDSWTLCKVNGGSAINNPNCTRRKTVISCKPLGDFATLLYLMDVKYEIKLVKNNCKHFPLSTSIFKKIQGIVSKIVGTSTIIKYLH